MRSESVAFEFQGVECLTTDTFCRRADHSCTLRDDKAWFPSVAHALAILHDNLSFSYERHLSFITFPWLTAHEIITLPCVTPSADGSHFPNHFLFRRMTPKWDTPCSGQTSEHIQTHSCDIISLVYQILHKLNHSTARL